MPAIFISHSSRDPKIADDIKAALQRLGYEQVFLDFDKDTGIGAGADWEKVLYDRLARCHALILVLTPNWLNSTWCRIELAQARALGKVILPVICEPLGDRYVLPEVQAVDLIDWTAGGVERIEQRLRAITNELARGYTFDPNRLPYPGIHAFEAEDAAIYFGRDEEVRSVIERLDARRTRGGARLLVIIGASGAGKSSLLKAGVLPQLARRKRDWIVLPPLRPEKAPMEALAKAIAQHRGRSEEWRSWQERLVGPGALDAVAELIKDLRIGERSRAMVLLPIDQFEEVFTVATADERAAVLHLLAGALDPARDLPMMVLATGRSDVLDGLIEAGELARLYETESLTPLPLDRLARLIEGPAAVASLNVDRGLAECMARDLESPEALPLLAHTLWLLYVRGASDRRLSLDAYRALGDSARGLNPIQNSVRLAADQALDGLTPKATEAELTALRDAFVPHLVRVRLDDGKRVRQPARMQDLPEESRRLARALVASRLLVTRDGQVEVAHEALFKAWPTLDGWLSEEHGFLSDSERIRSAREVWAQAPPAQQAGELLHGLLLSRARDWLTRYPQRFIARELEPLRLFIAASAQAEDAARARSHRLRRRLFQGVAAAAVIFACATAVAGWQYYEAERARRSTEAARQEAVAERDRAERNFAIAKEAADDVVFSIAQDLRHVGGMRVESVRRILDAAQALMDKLARAAPDDLPLQRSRAAMLSEFVDTFLAAGDLSRAQIAAEESLAIMRKLAAGDPGNAEWQHDLSVSVERVGDVRFAAGDRAGALAAYQESVEIMRKLAAGDPRNAGWQRALSVRREKVGDMRLAAGDRVGALAAYEESLAIRRKLAAADPGNAGWQRDLSVSLDKVGDVRLTAGDRAGALAAYEDSLAITRKLAAGDPGNAEWQTDLVISLYKNSRASDVPRAQAALREALAILEVLAREGKLSAEQQGWAKSLQAELDKLPRQ